jgi:hypothetical protein
MLLRGRRDHRTTSSWKRLGVHPALAVALVVVAGLFVGVKVSALGSVAGGGATRVGCDETSTPTAVRMSLAELQRAVADSGVASLRGGGTRDTQGLQEPSASWSDAFPSSAAARSTASATLDAGYELRWWSNDQDHQAADLFVFSDARDAARYVRQAASIRCRQEAVTYRLAQPAGGHALVWTNPDGAREADVFFARGERAYRLVDVPPPSYLQGAYRLDGQELIALPQLLACRVSQAGCGRPAPRPALSAAAYDALKIFASAYSRIGALPAFETREVMNRACVTVGRISDPEARLFYEDCQVTLHWLADAVYAARCYRSGPCQQWALATAAGDQHRMAAIERQLAAGLTAGTCRTDLTRDATGEDQLGQAYLLYGRALAARNAPARRLTRARWARLVRAGVRNSVTPSQVIHACAPAGASLWPPEVS